MTVAHSSPMFGLNGVFKSPWLYHPDRSRSSRTRWSAEWRDLVLKLSHRRDWGRVRMDASKRDGKTLSSRGTSPLKPKSGLNGDRRF